MEWRRVVWAARTALVTVAVLGAGEIWAQPIECAFPGNQLVNCGFDADLSGWSLAIGTFSHQPDEGFPQPGCLEVAAQPTQPPNPAFHFEQTVPNLAPSASYAAGIDVRVVSGAPDECWLNVGFPGSHWWEINFTPSQEWTRFQYSLTPTGGQASSAIFGVSCLSYSAQPFSLRLDDALLQPISSADVGVVLTSCSSSVALGGAVAYSVKVSNKGPGIADVQVVGDLPGLCRWSCVSWTGIACTTGPVQGALADVAHVPSHASALYEVTCLGVQPTADRPDDLVSATVSVTAAGGPDPYPADNTSTISHLVVPWADRPYVKGDLTGDMQADLLLRHEPTWLHVAWEQIGSLRLGTPLEISPSVSPPWRLEGVDDFDGDRRNDLVFRNPLTGAVQFWLMDGVVRRGEPVPIGNAPVLASSWKIAATGDFDYDGTSDLLWRDSSTQKIVIWIMNATERVGTLVPSPDQAVHANWEIVAALDYDGDGWRDLLWYNSTSGRIVLWLMDSQATRRTGFFAAPPNAGNNNWKVLASADYGGGPEAGAIRCTNDLVWRNADSGMFVLWHMDKSGVRTIGTFTTPPGPVPDPTDWTLTGPY